MKVSKQFLEAFDLCMKHYECTLEEVEYEKQRVRANYEEASRCYISIANGIRNMKVAA